MITVVQSRSSNAACRRNEVPPKLSLVRIAHYERSEKCHGFEFICLGLNILIFLRWVCRLKLSLRGEMQHASLKFDFVLPFLDVFLFHLCGESLSFPRARDIDTVRYLWAVYICRSQWTNVELSCTRQQFHSYRAHPSEESVIQNSAS